jgi:predicted TIM-barrel fold metal-dependent hydrolase
MATEKRALPIRGRRDRDRWGNPEALLPYLDREGVTHVVALNFYPTGVMRRVYRSRLPPCQGLAERDQAELEIERRLADGVRAQNDWLCRLATREPRIVAGIGIQKLLSPDEMVQEIETRAAQGARAVKLVPGWFHEFPNDRAFWPAYRRCEELGLVLTADTGTLGLGRHQAHPDQENRVCYGEPARFVDVLEAFPGLTVVMCHFPSAFWEQRVELARRYPNLVFDISGGFGGGRIRARDGELALPEVNALPVLRQVGIERFMFGSDGPHVMARPAIQQLRRLGLSRGELELVSGGNALRIYRIEV